MAVPMCRSLLLLAVVQTALLCGCTAYASGGDGFSVEFIHRDSPKSPFHDPSLTPQARLLAAVKRSSAVRRSYNEGSPGGAVSEVLSLASYLEYLMYVYVGTPRTRMLAFVDTGSNLLWLRCSNGTTGGSPPPPSGWVSPEFDPSSSSTYGFVGCQSDACHSVYGSSCDAQSLCNYSYSYIDGTNTSGVVSTETFTFDDAPGGCVGCRERPQLQVPTIFGCATTVKLNGNGLVGLGDGKSSLINQIGAKTSLGRRFSYCMASFFSNVSSALNFGNRAAVTEPDAVTAPMVPSAAEAYYTVEIVALRIGKTIIFKREKRYPVVVDTGTVLTYLDKELLDPIVEALAGSINLPGKRVANPGEQFPLCYDVPAAELEKVFPEVTLELGAGALVKVKAENVFVEFKRGTSCLTMSPVTPQRPVATIGSIAQQNMHVGYDLDKRTVTFASADCARSSPYAPPSSA